MVISLAGRIGKLEAVAGSKDKPYPKVVRLIVNQGEEADAYRQAEEMGLDVSPESRDLLIIRLVVPSPDGPKWRGEVE